MPVWRARVLAGEPILDGEGILGGERTLCGERNLCGEPNLDGDDCLGGERTRAGERTLGGGELACRYIRSRLTAVGRRVCQICGAISEPAMRSCYVQHVSYDCRGRNLG